MFHFIFQVLQISCKKRIGKDDFISSVRKSLQAQYKEKAVGMNFITSVLLLY
jgi:hypothetical protein